MDNRAVIILLLLLGHMKNRENWMNEYADW